MGDTGGSRASPRVAPLGNSARARPVQPVSAADSARYNRQFRASQRRQRTREILSDAKKVREGRKTVDTQQHEQDRARAAAAADKAAFAAEKAARNSRR